MTNSVSVASIINLIGEDRIREELDKNMWYVQFIDTHSRYDYHLTRFTTTSNPIKYLLFNDVNFFQYIGFRLPDIYPRDMFKNKDDYLEWLSRQEYEIMVTAAKLLWKTIKSYSHSEIKTIIHSTNTHFDSIFVLLDKDGTKIFPDSDNHYINKCDAFLTQWFPK